MLKIINSNSINSNNIISCSSGSGSSNSSSSSSNSNSSSSSSGYEKKELIYNRCDHSLVNLTQYYYYSLINSHTWARSAFAHHLLTPCSCEYCSVRRGEEGILGLLVIPLQGSGRPGEGCVVPCVEEATGRPNTQFLLCTS